MFWVGNTVSAPPGRLLGDCFLLVAVAYACYVTSTLSAFDSLWNPLNFAARVCTILYSILFALFTWRVFCPTERWGGWIVSAIAVSLVIGVGASAISGDWAGFSISSSWFWFEWVGYTLPYCWAGAEAFAQYWQARRRSVAPSSTTPRIPRPPPNEKP